MDRLKATDIKFLKGVGPARAKLLNTELGIHTLYDLVTHYPTHYIDRSRFYKIADFTGDMPAVQIKGQFVNFSIHGEGAKQRLIGLFSDGSATMEVVWFRRIKWIRDSYKPQTEYVLFGKPTNFAGRWSLVHPEIDRPESLRQAAPLRGVYPLTEKLRNQGITSRTLAGYITTLFKSFEVGKTDPLPEEMRQRLKLMNRAEALRTVHMPSDYSSMQRARERLKLEELLLLQINLLSYSTNRRNQSIGLQFSKIGHFFNSFYSDRLPFPLTNAQKRVIKEIRADMNTGHQMNRLLQGDVGSGKTLVALMCMLIALDNESQACLMAPTEILATQHFESLRKMVAPLGISVKLLTGSTGAAERREIHQGLQSGSLHILIGTHAVLEDCVQFRNLGLVVIDEQHRFGVAQRARMWRKNTIAPHILVMTATPIPRTLAMTAYGDLEVSVIDELPPGRKPITTLLRFDDQRLDVYRAMARQIKQGRQAYVVFPLINENDKIELKSLEEGYANITETFRHHKVAYVHGKMKPVEKDAHMNAFASHEADILVATTVIEVGVNVPNATMMIIENAERFGLSQLHQLRGRVGRGADQSYCILMSRRNISSDTRKRLEIMTSTTDGFLVADADLKMRGPGAIDGTMQSGMPLELNIANIATDSQLVSLARHEAEALLDEDPHLSDIKHQILRREIKELFAKTVDWSSIS